MGDSAVSQTTIQIAKDEGIVEIRRKHEGDGFEIELLLDRSDLYIPKKSCQTTFPLELIQYWLDRASFASFCEVIGRHEDTIPGAMRTNCSHISRLKNSEGNGSWILGVAPAHQLFPSPDCCRKPKSLGLSWLPIRLKSRTTSSPIVGCPMLRFSVLLRETGFQPVSGDFDFVMLSAVYEHLLPDERKTIMPLLWSAMKPGGAIFINLTPYRYSPYEAHSTGLWFINYLPDGITHWTVRHFAKRNPLNRSEDWNVHLRGGLRGATEREIIWNLTRGHTQSARVLQPRQNGLRDRADFWFSCTNPRRYRTLKKSIAAFFRFTDRVWGTVPGVNLEVVIQKRNPL